MGMRALLLFLAAAAACCMGADVTAGEGAGPAELLLPGDAAPALPLKEWLQRGAFDDVRPANGRLVTVIEFFAAWDPLSRTVLPMHDQLQAKLAAGGVRFLMVSEESPEAVRAYLKQAKLRNVAVACDEQQTALGLFADLRDNVSIPYAVLLEGTPGRFMWHGPVVEPGSSEAPTAAFDGALRQVMEGRYDVGAAREVEVGIRELDAVQEELCSLAQAGKLEELRAAAARAQQRAWPRGCEMAVATALGWPAYFLVGQGEPSPEKGAVALDLADAAVAAMERAGESEPSLLHVRALARAACGVQPGAPAAEPPAPAPLPPPKEADRLSPATLSGEAAAEDLAALHERLRTSYSAYDDADWVLRATGSSWDRRASELRSRLEARVEWPTGEFFDLLGEHLKVAGDRHLTLTAKLPSAEGVQGRWERPAPLLVVFFADVRVEYDGEHCRLREVPADVGRLRRAEPVDVPTMDSPLTARAGEAYLFPTLPRQRGAREYLIGVLADPRRAPTELSLTVTGAAGRETVTLPVHRGRVSYQGDDSTAWQIDMRPMPRLSVRTMDVTRTTDLPGSALTLRQHQAAMLDLRGNGGGGDPIVRDWCALFTDQRLRMTDGWCEIRPGETDPLRRWNSWLNGLMAWEWRAPAEAAVTPHYAGTLYILADSGTGSAAESFVCLASQIEGAVLLGENTAGCDMYGNRDSSIVLPYSRIEVSYSRTKGMAHGRPFREAVGFFPDYWLDTEDPVGAITEYLGRCSPSAPPP